MTFKDLLQQLVNLDQEQLSLEISLFDYKQSKFVDLPELSLCCEGEPAAHLTIN